MKIWFWIIIVIILSTLALYAINNMERSGETAGTVAERTMQAIFVGSDDNAGGCADAYPVRDVPVVSRRIESLFAALPDFEAPEGLLNPVKKYGLSLKVGSSLNGTVMLDITGSPKLGGVCDAGRLKDQIERTLKLYTDDFEIRLNGSVDAYKCMRLVTGECAKE